MFGRFTATAEPTGIVENFLHGKTSVWIGALSFEERCIASLQQLANLPTRLDRGFLLKYSTKVEPQYQDVRLRKGHLDIITRLGDRVFKDGCLQVEVDPYSFEAFSIVFNEIIAKSKTTLVICDVTCFTKIHTLALAAGIQRHSEYVGCIVVHAVPENYVMGDSRSDAIGWRDVIVAPLAAKATLFNETRGRGIILLGHEADRLVVALAELEPAGGTVLLSTTEGRPDLRRISQRFNRKVLRHLMRLRSHTWRTEILDVSDLERLHSCVGSEIHVAKEFQAPVVLFPFGPKPLVLLTALQLSAEYSEAAWFVYPVPASYDINYTEGIQGCLWLTPAAQPVSDVD